MTPGYLRNLHPSLHLESRLGFKETQRISDRPSGDRAEADGPAEPQHGGVGDSHDGPGQAVGSAAYLVRHGASYWIPVKVN